MGIIVALLVAGGKKDWATGGVQFLGHKHQIALWIILSCHAAMALGTMFGGWRIVKTMGSRITPHLRPAGGFSAECGAAITIGLATFAHVPISTTHAIGGCRCWSRRDSRCACGSVAMGTANRVGLGFDVSVFRFDRRTFLSLSALRNSALYPGPFDCVGRIRSFRSRGGNPQDATRVFVCQDSLSWSGNQTTYSYAFDNYKWALCVGLSSIESVPARRAGGGSR